MCGLQKLPKVAPLPVSALILFVNKSFRARSCETAEQRQMLRDSAVQME